jgi:DME family drug/metabolite transporter
MSHHGRAALGIAGVLGAAVLWGTTGTAQSFVPATLSSVWVGALRLVAASAFFAVWVAWTERTALRGLGGVPWPWRGIAAAAVCMTVYNLAFFAGVRATGVAVGTAVAIGSGPVWAGVLQWGVDRRPPAAVWWLGTGLAVTGGALMIGSAGAATAVSAAGVAACLTAGLAYAAYAMFNKHVVTSTPAASVGIFTGAIFVLAAGMAAPIAWALAGPPVLRMADLVVVGWLGVMSTGVAYLLLSHALRTVSSATAVTLALAEPVTAFVLALVVVGERPGALALLGLVVVLAGLALVIRAELRADHGDARLAPG